MDERVFDAVETHLEAAGSLAAAALPMAWFAAWAAQHQLLSGELVANSENQVLRLRYREITPNEFFVPVFAGVLRADQFSDSGQQFVLAHYAPYARYLQQAFGERLYAQEDNWDSYDRVAPFLSQRLMGAATTRDKTGGNDWWKFWK